MGTIERGESNVSFQNIVKVAGTLGVSLSVLFADLESAAEKLRRAEHAPPRIKKTPNK
jgi:transcriptional regulator with XRE-family HTH domain